ncbi:hypothetical protein GGI25_003524 [Coemansia spiralis]|uniref:SHSP domain-containing protein n=2 Tax=Coemansia TaxID=4863 RepID=A0A9W8KXG6_9FUNG|nr:hypothetical protein BX070DRAFT_226601 [Coemansia spiralis]KAJ1990414.1 hypothetical protein EDC05_004058 [Coemansia umbellata]KAJ2622099.1 hypothetical protein GGI26_003541 [Coemansia sp. RSA 1358]KAJ2676489.1 hypothetical protein GGI25_003524 [Coemansia spiralis]
MSAFHNDIFNRRSSNAFLNEFRQDNRSGVFAAPMMPKPLFCDDGPSRHQRSSSFTNHSHFAYVAGCEICEEYISRGAEICHHEHRVVCRGIQRGCGCNHCCHKRDSEVTRCNTPLGFSARTEESVSDSRFGNGRVRARSATTTVGDASFGFANMDTEMLRAASDNRWRSSNSNDSFYAKPFNPCAPPPPPGHMHLRENNVGHVFEANQQLHGHKQSDMRAEAAAHFNGYNRPMPLFSSQYGKECDDEEVKVTKTTTTTTTRTTRECNDDEVCHKPQPLPPPKPEVVHHPVEHHHVEKHEHHLTVIPVGTRPDVPVRPAEPCCTWCKFLPCLSCPKPTNPNARFKKINFRLYPEYEFLPEHIEVPKSTEYFPEHTNVASRTEYKVTVPKANQIAQRIYVDFIGDQMIVIGEHGRPVALNRKGVRHVTSSPSMRSTRSSFNSRETAHVHHAVPGHHTQIPGVSKVFAKNFFLPRDTYDRDRAQAFIKPNGKLKIVVPVLES